MAAPYLISTARGPDEGTVLLVFDQLVDASCGDASFTVTADGVDYTPSFDYDGTTAIWLYWGDGTTPFATVVVTISGPCIRNGSFETMGAGPLEYPVPYFHDGESEDPEDVVGSLDGVIARRSLTATGTSTPPVFTGSASIARGPLVEASGLGLGVPGDPTNVGFAGPHYPVARWGFDETSGATAADSSGWGRTGAFSSAPSWTAGRFGGAAGVGSRTFAFPAATLGASFTLALWVRPDAGGENSRRDLAVAGPFAAYLSTTNRLAVGGMAASTSAVVDYAGWTHLAVAVGGGTIRLYVNGVREATAAWTGPDPLLLSGLFTSANPYLGAVDDARIYADALGDAAVAALASGTLPDGIVVSRPALAAAGTASRPVFSGSVSHQSRRELGTTALAEHDVFRGTLSQAVKRRSLAAIGSARYAFTGSADVARRPTVSLAGSNQSPREFAVFGRGSDGWGMVASFPIFGQAAEPLSAEFPIVAPHVAGPRLVVEFPVFGLGAGTQSSRTFDLVGTGRSWEGLSRDLSITARGSWEDLVGRSFPIFGAGGRTAALGDFTVFGQGALSGAAAGEFTIHALGAGLGLSADFLILGRSDATASRTFALFGIGRGLTPGARPLAGVFDIRWETGLQRTFPIFGGAKVASAAFDVRSRGAGVLSAEFPLRGTAFGGVSSREFPIVGPLVVAPTSLSGEFLVAAPGILGGLARTFPISSNGWSP